MVDAVAPADWPVEEIPGTARLFVRVHQDNWRDGRPKEGAFRFRGATPTADGSLSSNWDKYSDPEDTRVRSKEPHRNGVISLNVGFLTDELRLRVQHSPDHCLTRDPTTPWVRPNRAHTDVWSLESPEIRVLLRRECRVERALDG